MVRIIVSDMLIKLDALGYIYDAESLGVSSTTFVQCAPEAAEFGEITQNKGLCRWSRSFKVTDFSSNRKLIYDFY